MLLDGSNLFVAGQATVTELNASTGALVRVLSSSAYQFNGPDAMVVDGPDLFVTNAEAGATDDGSVTELNASTGALVRVLSAPVYQFSGPTAMATDGGDVFVLDTLGGVTELNTSTGALVRLVPPAWYGFSSPNAMVRHGDELYVLNSDQAEGVAVLNASNGAAMGVLSGGFDFPEALAAYGDDLFVASSNGSSVTEVNASTGTLVRQLSGPSYRFDSLGPMVADKDDLFVASGDELCASPPYGCPNFAVTEVNGDSGAVVRVISGGSFDYPDAMVVDGPNLFIANGCGCGKRRGSVTEVNARTGALVRVIAAPAYDFEGPAALAVDGPDLFVLNGDGNSVTELPR